MPTELEQRAREILRSVYTQHENYAIGAPMLAMSDSAHSDRIVIAAIAAALQAQQPNTLCEDCPPVGYPTDTTRCDPCPRKAQQPSAQAVAYCDQSDPINSTAFAWPGTDRSERHREPLFAHPQPPSIPEPSEEDVEAAFKARWPLHWNVMSAAKRDYEMGEVRNIITTYTARLRERIGGGV